MLFTKRKNDGSVPLKYKPGKIKNNEYRSNCFGYAVRIADGIEVQKAGYHQDIKDVSDFGDFFAISASNIRFGVVCVPSDGSMIVSDNTTRDQLCNCVQQSINQRFHGEKKSIYYGMEDFCGKPCGYSVMHNYQNGQDWINEIYQYYSTYYMLQFGFTYLQKDAWHVDEIKALFSPLP